MTGKKISFQLVLNSQKYKSNICDKFKIEETLKSEDKRIKKPYKQKKIDQIRAIEYRKYLDVKPPDTVFDFSHDEEVSSLSHENENIQAFSSETLSSKPQEKGSDQAFEHLSKISL